MIPLPRFVFFFKTVPIRRILCDNVARIVRRTFLLERHVRYCGILYDGFLRGAGVMENARRYRNV